MPAESDRLTSPGRLGTATRAPLVELNRVSKRYGATRALTDVSFRAEAGTAQALVGRNGAGKSTLVGVLTGLVTPDEGTVRILGETVGTVGRQGHPAVACVHQHPQLVPQLSVAENLALGNDNRRFVHWAEQRDRAREILEHWQIPVRPDELAAGLDVEQRQLLEIARALSRGSQLVILDEPTSQLDRQASQRLFSHVRSFQAEGIGFVFISHHLEEVFEICDTATVLRDGRTVATRDIADLTPAALVDLMVGAEPSASPETEAAPTERAAGARTGPGLRAESLSWPGRFEDVGLEVAAGEIVALTGLAGSGKVAVAESIVGLHPRHGDVCVGGTRIRPRDVRAGQQAGIGFVPEDRHVEGFVPDLSIEENASMAVLPRLSRAGWIRRGRRHRLAEQLIRDLAIVPPESGYAVGRLSGGNQQKVVMARALASDPRVLVLIAPTAGVDIASKAALYAQIRRTAASGTAVLLVSDEVDEVALADRVLVMYAGRVTAELSAPWDQRSLVAAIEGVDVPETDSERQGR